MSKVNNDLKRLKKAMMKEVHWVFDKDKDTKLHNIEEKIYKNCSKMAFKIFHDLSKKKI